ncbi:MAG: DUF4476 domain-containing protein [Flavobacteriia bacterium]|nr:DUF4476 domain-containing protein [Flavobacteriia bacterium]
MKTRLLFGLFIFFTGQFYAAEIYIRVLKTGTHYATVYNQTQYNSTNIFRFFDLPGGNISIQIIEQSTGTFIWNSSMYLNSNQRIVAEIDNAGNLIILQNVTVEYSNWYTPVNSGNSLINGGTQSTFPNNGTNMGNNSGSNAVGVNNQMFTQFLATLDKESFDSKKLEKSKRYIDKGNLNASQIAEIAKKFSFDSNRLDWTKYAYSKCSDKVNYFILKDVFSFNSSYDELEDYTLNH